MAPSTLISLPIHLSNCGQRLAGLFFAIFVLRSIPMHTAAASFTVGVIGPKGRIGSHVVKKLSEMIPSTGIQLQEIHRESLHDRLSPHKNGGGFTNVDALVCCLGSGHLASIKSFDIDGKLVQRVISNARRDGVRHFCLLSSVGVDDFDTKWDEETKEVFGIRECISDKPGNTRPEVLHWKRESEMHLRASGSAATREESDMTHSILRLPHFILPQVDNASRILKKNMPQFCEFPAGSFSALPQLGVWAGLDDIAQFVSDEVLQAATLLRDGGGKVPSKTVELAVETNGVKNQKREKKECGKCNMCTCIR